MVAKRVRAVATERAVKLALERVLQVERLQACRLQPPCQRRLAPLPQEDQHHRDRRQPPNTEWMARAPRVASCPLPRQCLVEPELEHRPPGAARTTILGLHLRLVPLRQLFYHPPPLKAPPRAFSVQRTRDAPGATAGRCLAEATLRSGRPVAQRRATRATSTGQLVTQAYHAAKVLSRVSSAGRTIIPET